MGGAAWRDGFREQQLYLRQSLLAISGLSAVGVAVPSWDLGGSPVG